MSPSTQSKLDSVPRNGSAINYRTVTCDSDTVTHQNAREKESSGVWNMILQLSIMDHGPEAQAQGQGGAPFLPFFVFIIALCPSAPSWTVHPLFFQSGPSIRRTV
jgi:hypothetical protein